MTTGEDVFRKAKARARQLDNPPGAKVTGVTHENYANLAKAFMDGRGGKGFLIAERTLRGGAIQATIDEWAAWIAYWFKIGRPLGGIEQRGYATVPCQWPHDFDENAKLEDGLQAAKYHRETMRRRIAADKVQVDPKKLGKKIRSIWEITKEVKPFKDPMPIKVIQRKWTNDPTPEEMKASLERCLKAQGKEYQP